MTRETLPSRRAHEVMRFEFRGRTYFAGVGRFDDGRAAELFIDPRKAWADATADARDAAVAASIALQYGAPVKVLRDALTRDEAGNAAGVLGAALDALDREARK